MKLDEKKENTTEPINGSSVLSAVSGNTALNAGRLPRALHEELALILKRIGTKEHNTHALEQLYDLRVNNRVEDTPYYKKVLQNVTLDVSQTTFLKT